MKPARYKKRYLLIRQIALLVSLLWCWANSHAQPLSDLLLVVDSDGLGYTAQLTVIAEDEMIISRIPAQRETLQTAFAGDSSQLYQRAHEQSPDKITVTSGSVFTRFRHRFDLEQSAPAVAADDAEKPVVRASIDDFTTTMADAQSLSFRVSWILPENIELFDYGSTKPAPFVADGVWTLGDGNVLTFEQQGGLPSKPWLEYRVHDDHRQEQACLASVGPSEWCSPDIDNDFVPDYRDLCVAQSPEEDAIASEPDDLVFAENNYSEILADATMPGSTVDALGCEDDSRIILSQIQFASGSDYLNATARATLDKVAVALQRIPDKLYRIASFTDNAGYFNNNQRLSENRAAAIRHYLMLRGVSPNQIQARGFGETQPAFDNRTADGRRRNRRVELHLLN